MVSEMTGDGLRSGGETSASFGERLVAAGKARGQLCVGIDPHPHLLEQWGLPHSADGLRTFSLTCVEAFADTAAAVKPQVAFFERFGSAGFAVLEETLAALREAGCLSIADAKRGDIGSTMAGYADAWMDPASPLRADAVTVSPYLGVGALQPVFDKAVETGAGFFVLAATSNPEARDVQNAAVARQDDGDSGERELTVAQSVVDECARYNAQAPGVGNGGVVVGATVSHPPRLDELNGPVLLPGVGAQGSGAKDVRAIMGKTPELGFANVSRSVLSAGPQVADLRKQARRVAAQFAAQ